jgi:phosphatidylserine/phosphatidylglycerophosphate/cardiolipin synthase-like enzyme
VFEGVGEQCQRILILRDAGRYEVELSVEHAEWLRALRVSVRDYHLAHDPEAGRHLSIGIFHVKIVAADDAIAYVGSANFLSSSEGLCLETGLLIEGAAAKDVATLLEAVLRVARPL